MLDFPPFFLDFFNNRLLIAVVAIIHVVINHPFAVGGYPLIVLMEWWAKKTNNKPLDELAYKITFVVFIVTTTLGAMTGVGIWLSSSLISPFGIGSLLRVFFWAWFIEWLVFITEVALILVYFLTWKKWSSGKDKNKHIFFGVALSIFSWITMAIIVAILGFMMTPGEWNGVFMKQPGMLTAFFNPLYIPQLLFRTPFSLVTGALLIWFLTFFFTKKNDDLRHKVVRSMAIFALIFLPLTAIAGYFYWTMIPDYMQANSSVALLSQQFMQWQEKYLKVLGYMVATIGAVAGLAVWRPRSIPSFVLLIPFLISIWFLGYFERVREFIRKPYIIGEYMYSNGVRTDELPIFQRDGILPYATYAKHKRVNAENMVEAGQDVFMIACSRCHTTRGLNGVIGKFENMYGADAEWNDAAMTAFIQTMHTSRTYMPPFPGNDKELEALVAYIKHLRQNKALLPGAQSIGIKGRVQLQEINE